MLPFLPPEILDLIVDYLHDERTTLNASCVVSKSWIPRSRKHLFFLVEFSPKSPIESWIKAFLDPSSSPAHYTRILSLHNPKVSAPAWIRTFCHIVELRMSQCGDSRTFYRLSPTLESLSLDLCHIPLSELFTLICSFPVLRDMHLDYHHIHNGTSTDKWSPPSTSPELTGTLRLEGNIRSVIPRMLDLPKIFCFSSIIILCLERDADLAKDLVLRCSDTLESLSIGYSLLSAFHSASAVGQHLTLPLAPRRGGLLPSFDLSKATKLRDLEFRLYKNPRDVQWVSTTIQTAKSQGLRQINIYSRFSSRTTYHLPVTETISRGWHDLDHLLVQLWTSRSIRPGFTPQNWKEEGREDLASLLPGVTGRGALI